MNASLVIIGNEITRGVVQDAYTKRLGSFFTNLGIRVESVFILNDSKDILKYIDIASRNSNIIVTTGGLGPTEDDKTRYLISEFTSCKLEENELAKKNVIDRVGLEKFTKSNRKQAFIPKGFQPIINKNGSAPGFYGKVNDILYISLPGPVRESEGMLFDVHNIVCNNLKIGFDKCDEYSLFVISEARFNDCSNECISMLDNKDLEIGTCFRDYKISIYIYYNDEKVRNDYVEKISKILFKEFNEVFFFKGDVDIFSDFKNLLLDNKLTISTAESITGGFISKLITDMPGSSKYFKSGIVSYSNEVKMKELGVLEGTINTYSEVSRECAVEMSKNCLKKFSSDLSIAVTGYAGPDGEDVGKVFISLGCYNGGKTYEFHYKGSREYIRKRVAVASILLCNNLIRSLK